MRATITHSHRLARQSAVQGNINAQQTLADDFTRDFVRQRGNLPATLDQRCVVVGEAAQFKVVGIFKVNDALIDDGIHVLPLTHKSSTRLLPLVLDTHRHML